MNVIASTHRLRLALGIFRDVDTLRSALQALRDEGFAGDRVAIVAGRETLARLGWLSGEPAGKGDETAGPQGFTEKGFTEIGVAGKAGPLVASAGPIARLFVDWARRAGDRAQCLLDPWLDRAHASILQRQLDDGAVTLWVRVGDGSEELRACRILLRTSAERVQVHDVAEMRP
jgi:hypothetical protein